MSSFPRANLDRCLGAAGEVGPAPRQARVAGLLCLATKSGRINFFMKASAETVRYPPDDAGVPPSQTTELELDNLTAQRGIIHFTHQAGRRDITDCDQSRGCTTQTHDRE